MAAGGDGKLTNKHIARLCTAIATPVMENIALGYLDIEDETIQSLKAKNVTNPQNFNKEIIMRWANKNSGSDQVKKLAAALYEAADDEGVVNPDKIYDILKVTKEQAKSTTPPAANSVPAPAQPPAKDAAPATQPGSNNNRPMLTDQKTQKLSARITDVAALQKLAVSGLGVDDYEVDKYIKGNKSDITTATYEFLKYWIGKCEDEYEAHEKLCSALDASDMRFLKKVLR